MLTNLLNCTYLQVLQYMLWQDTDFYNTESPNAVSSDAGIIIIINVSVYTRATFSFFFFRVKLLSLTLFFIT